MPTIPRKISSRFNKEEIFLINDEATSQKIILVAYPHWEAYSSDIDSDIWVRVTPALDLRNRCIILGEALDKDEELKKKTENTRSTNKALGIIKVPSGFINSIPEDILESVKAFNESHWEVISAVVILGKDFIKLLQTNPQLAYLIVNLEMINGTIRIYNERARLNRLIRTKQREILRLAYLPSTEHMKKLFSKIDLEYLSRSRLLNICRFFYLQQNSSKRITKLLSHLKTINKNLLMLLSYHHEIIVLLSPKTTEVLIESDSFNEQLIILEKIRKRSAEVGAKFPIIEDLKRLDEIDAINKERVAFKKREKEFPDSPYVGNETIIPIKTEKELISWSKIQHNCIRTYMDKIKRLESFFYRINFNGEQATLELQKRNNVFVLHQLAGFKNQSVSYELEKLVNQWLAKAQIS